MSENSKIEWTDHTFNPWKICTPVSLGCKNCYAAALAKRFGWGEYKKGVPRQLTGESNWRKALNWNRIADSFRECPSCGRRDHMAESCPLCGTLTVPVRQRVFCASLADWLDDEVPIEWLARLLKLIFETPNLDWLLLTKRPQNWEKRMGELLGCYLAMNRTEGNAARLLESWFGARVAPANVWIGTTVEDQARADERIPQLLQIPAKVRFLSCEPLLGAVDLSECFSLWEYCGGCGEQFDFVEGRPDECPSCKRKWCMCVGYGEGARRMHFDADGRIEVCDGAPIHWVICGGESGPNARPMHPDWARSLRDQCAAAGVPFLFKQWGEWRPTFALHDFIDDDGEDFARGDFTGYERVGKKTAGRLLDGKEHNAFPV